MLQLERRLEESDQQHVVSLSCRWENEGACGHIPRYAHVLVEDVDVSL